MADKQPYDWKHMQTTLDGIMLAWSKEPYLRLGQLLMNSSIGVLPTWDGPPDLFYVEDEALVKMVSDFADK